MMVLGLQKVRRIRYRQASGEGIRGLDPEKVCTFSHAGANAFGFTNGEFVDNNMHRAVYPYYPDGRGYLHEDCPPSRSI